MTRKIVRAVNEIKVSGVEVDVSGRWTTPIQAPPPVFVEVWWPLPPASNSPRSFDATLGQLMRRLEVIERRLAALAEQPKRESE